MDDEITLPLNFCGGCIVALQELGYAFSGKANVSMKTINRLDHFGDYVILSFETRDKPAACWFPFINDTRVSMLQGWYLCLVG